MSQCSDRIKEAIEKSGLTYAELEIMTGVTKSSLQRYAAGVTKKIPTDCIEAVASATGVTAAYLMGWTDDPVDYGSAGYVSDAPLDVIANFDGNMKKAAAFQCAQDDDAQSELVASVGSNISAVYSDHIRMIPLYESVSAGFGAQAVDNIVGYIPARIVSDYEAEETICIRVSGNSMYPKIEDGDIIFVHKQPSVDCGDTAVLLIDDEEGVVKKVEYGTDWVELISINPEYMPRRFSGAELERLKVVGKVKGSYKPF